VTAGPSRLKPGEKGSIITRVETLSKSNPLEETVEVMSNDPKRPRVVLTVRANLVDILVPSPDQNLPFK